MNKNAIDFFKKYLFGGQAWQHTPLIPALGRQRQENLCKVKVSLVYRVLEYKRQPLEPPHPSWWACEREPPHCQANLELPLDPSVPIPGMSLGETNHNFIMFRNMNVHKNLIPGCGRELCTVIPADRCDDQTQLCKTWRHRRSKIRGLSGEERPGKTEGLAQGGREGGCFPQNCNRQSEFMGLSKWFRW